LPHAAGQAVLLVFVGRFVRLESVYPLRDEGGFRQVANRLAEARTRSEGFTARARSHFRLPPRSNRLHENTSGIMRTVITEALHIAFQEMLEVFNMGIGLVLVVAKRNAAEVIERTAGKIIGQITPGSRKVLVT